MLLTLCGFFSIINLKTTRNNTKQRKTKKNKDLTNKKPQFKQNNRCRESEKQQRKEQKTTDRTDDGI